jgi:small subunit ribosomal protein S24e
MELEVVAKKENPLLKRVEITFKAVHKAEPTPTRDAIRSELAKQLKASKEAVIVDRSESSFGRYETRGYAKIYTSKEEALSIERSHILIRNKLKEPEAKAKEGEKAEKPPKAERPAPKAEPKAEAPKAEPKPEHKPEAKAEHNEEKPAAKEEKKGGEKHEEKKEAKPEAKKAEPKKKEGK